MSEIRQRNLAKEKNEAEPTTIVTEEETTRTVTAAQDSLPQQEQQQPRPRFLSSRALKRLLLLLLTVGAVVGFQQGWFGGSSKPKVIYASRYSDEYKFRPAASPVITETLADGRIRLRGASPAGVGIDASSIPKTPQQLAKERKAAEEEALERAKAQLGIKSRKKKEKSNLEKMREQGIPMAGSPGGAGAQGMGGQAGFGGGGAGAGGLGGRGSGSGGPAQQQKQRPGMNGMGKGTAIRGGKKGIKVKPGMDGRAL
ncbi:hypothetical protein QFC22_005546 [Naganishia vaughanmartiniae]|uniref:Uncharacterized protein n=1 Tax=Naganishia vaughanmartiniae TaxID=1424756 RepID=A0ACC2WSC0_9TREE|nr:hypothetical protein QFC22_005546 [Naganishia vaughanmartiniae]